MARKKRAKKSGKQKKLSVASCLEDVRMIHRIECGLAVAMFVIPSEKVKRKEWPKGKKLTVCQVKTAAAGISTAKGLIDTHPKRWTNGFDKGHPGLPRVRSALVRAEKALGERDVPKLRTHLQKAHKGLMKIAEETGRTCERSRS